MKYPNARILQFAKAPRAGHVKTRLIPALGAEGALQLHKKLLTHTWKTLNAARLAPMQLWVDSYKSSDFFGTLWPPVTVPEVQQGGDLGERMAHAVKQSLKQCDMVVVVGSDCPVLDSHYLDMALESLQRGADVVLGPASDGGYVLIGMRQFYREPFEGISWGTGEVLQQTRCRLEELKCQWHELSECWDVDRAEDLVKLERLVLF